MSVKGPRSAEVRLLIVCRTHGVEATSRDYFLLLGPSLTPSQAIQVRCEAHLRGHHRQDQHEDGGGTLELVRLAQEKSPASLQTFILPEITEEVAQKSQGKMADLDTSLKGPRRSEVRLLLPPVEVLQHIYFIIAFLMGSLATTALN